MFASSYRICLGIQFRRFDFFSAQSWIVRQYRDCRETRKVMHCEGTNRGYLPIFCRIFSLQRRILTAPDRRRFFREELRDSPKQKTSATNLQCQSSDLEFFQIGRNRRRCAMNFQHDGRRNIVFWDCSCRFLDKNLLGSCLRTL